MASFDLDTIRIALHLLGVVVWLGGQLVVGALVPVLRGIDEEAPRIAARQFGRIAWPFFGLLVITGFWNVAEVDPGSVSTGYNAVLGIKLLLVAVSGIAAFAHTNTESTLVRAVTGGGGAVAAFGAFLCGVMLVS
jgi:putative copper export protein